MTDLAASVRAVLERSVLPSVIARGGSLRVAGVEDGVVILETSGSPGVALPLASRMETLIRAAVPEVTAVRVVGPGGEPPPAPAGDLADGRAAAAAVPGITGLTITVPVGQRVRPLPEGDRYVGFIFAEADTPEGAAAALRAARSSLRLTIQ